MSYLLPLEECGDANADRVGGKARGLHFLLSQQLPVPSGFVVTTDAYRDCVAAAGIEAQITQIAAQATTPMECQAASEQIRALFKDSMLLADIATEISQRYLALDPGHECAVAVRSSATAEDTAEASFAGQQDTYLFISGVADVTHHVVKCWASLYTAQAIGYRARFGINNAGLAMAVVVQRMVPADAAGVMMSLDPATGDDSCIYIESAIGLGEGVVRGDVGCDRFWVNKATLQLTRQEINHKQRAHRYVAAMNEVRMVDVPEAIAHAPALSANELEELARLARQAESTFGSAVDMEWAVAADHGTQRKVYLLQARAETVWAAKPKTGTVKNDAWDSLHGYSAPHSHWTTANYGEAMPGVLSPLSWDFWGYSVEKAMRGSFHALGALSSREAEVSPDPNQRITRIFYGRPALEVEYLAAMGDRMPGTTGPLVVQDILGNVPDDLAFAPTWRRYPFIFWRAPWAFMTAPGRLRRMSAESAPWWHDCIARVGQMDYATAIATMKEANRRFVNGTTLQAIVLMGVVTPLYNALGVLVKKTGVGDTAALGGFGGAEMDVVIDIWRASRGEIDDATLVALHGYHGPMEGELASVVWREDATPLRKLVTEYAARPEDQDPRLHLQERKRVAEQVTRDVLAVVAPLKRPLVRLLLKLAARGIPLRGVAKQTFLRAFDVIRTMARRAGVLLLEQGKIDSVDDVFYLTYEELCALPGNARELIKLRRQRRAYYKTLNIPGEWTGMPVATRADHVGDEHDADVRGTGVSPGIVEGIARVLQTPDFEQVKQGEILVSPTTDPSWSSVMFISSALVVDIGGALSHAAIVARELGIPCVVNTQDGSRRLHSGDRIRVDGAAGTVEILERSSVAEIAA